MCREFIIMINSDVFKNLLILYSKFKGGAHVRNVTAANAPTPKRPYDVSREQNQYLRLPLL